MLVPRPRGGDVELAGLRAEVAGLKDSRRDAEAKACDALKVIEALRAEKKGLMTDKAALNALVVAYQKIEKDLNDSKGKLIQEKAELLASFAAEKAKLEGELASAAAASAKSAEEAFKSLENGYTLCWERAVVAGYNMDNHTFQKYCEETAMEADGAQSSNHAGDGAVVG